MTHLYHAAMFFGSSFFSRVTSHGEGLVSLALSSFSVGIVRTLLSASGSRSCEWSVVAVLEECREAVMQSRRGGQGMWKTLPPTPLFCRSEGAKINGSSLTGNLFYLRCKSLCHARTVVGRAVIEIYVSSCHMIWRLSSKPLEWVRNDTTVESLPLSYPPFYVFLEFLDETLTPSHPASEHSCGWFIVDWQMGSPVELESEKTDSAQLPSCRRRTEHVGVPT